MNNFHIKIFDSEFFPNYNMMNYVYIHMYTHTHTRTHTHGQLLHTYLERSLSLYTCLP